jgi:hypothetical protein
MQRNRLDNTSGLANRWNGGVAVEWSRVLVVSFCPIYKGDEVLTITTHGWVLPEKKMIAAQSFTEAVGNIANNAFGRDTSVLCSMY